MRGSGVDREQGVGGVWLSEGNIVNVHVVLHVGPSPAYSYCATGRARTPAGSPVVVAAVSNQFASLTDRFGNPYNTATK